MSRSLGDALSLDGTLALSKALKTQPFSRYSTDAEVCTWGVGLGRYAHEGQADLLIALLTKGRIRWESRDGYDGGSFHHGKVTVIPAGRALEVEPECPFSAITLVVSLERIGRLFQSDLDEVLTNVSDVKIGSEQPLVANLLLELSREIEDPIEISSIYIESLIDLIVRKVIKNGRKFGNTTSGSPLGAPTLKRIRDFILDNLDAPLTIKELSKLAGQEETVFCKAFKRSTGVPPHRYVTELRIDRAMNLLGNSNRELVDIALEVGFSSHSHLCDAFRRVVGRSPSNYRREIVYRR